MKNQSEPINMNEEIKKSLGNTSQTTTVTEIDIDKTDSFDIDLSENLAVDNNYSANSSEFNYDIELNSSLDDNSTTQPNVSVNHDTNTHIDLANEIDLEDNTFLFEPNKIKTEKKNSVKQSRINRQAEHEFKEPSAKNTQGLRKNSQPTEVKHVYLNKGRCTNLPTECSKAESSELQNIISLNSRCAECNALLFKQTQNRLQNSRNLSKYILLIALSLLITGLVFWLISQLNSDDNSSQYVNQEASSDISAPVDNTENKLAIALKPTPTNVTQNDLLAQDQLTQDTPVEQTDTNRDNASLETPLDTILNIQGSHVIGSTIMPKLLNAYYIKQGNQSLGIQNTSLNDKVLTYQSSSNKEFAVNIGSHSSDSGITALLDNQANIAMSSIKLSDEEIAAANLQEKIIGIDGIAIIVHPSNPINDLTIDQLRGVFTGKYSNWKEIGGRDEDIHLYIRNENTGTRDTFDSLVLNQIPISNAKVVGNSQLLSDEVTNDTGAIGYVGLPYANMTNAIGDTEINVADIKKSKIAITKPIGIARNENTQHYKPNPLTIADKTYPLTRPLYLYLPNQPTEDANNLVDFIVSDTGQKIIQQAGVSRVDVQVDVSKNQNPTKPKTQPSEENEPELTNLEANKPESNEAVATQSISEDIVTESHKESKVQASVTTGKAVSKKLAMVNPNDSKVLEGSTNYKKLSDNAKQVNATIYFNNNNSELNQQAKKDLAQLKNLLADFHNKGQDKQLLLVGFTDSKGDKCLNNNLSIDRADFVANKLQTKYGIKTAVFTGMGSDAPVAENNTPIGRQKNRRVEIWLTNTTNLAKIPKKKHVMCP